MGLALKKPVEKFTYGDYLSWDDKENWEIIHGEAYNMSPAPPTIHQLIAGELFLQIGNQLKGKSCRVIPAPFDVRFPEKNQTDSEIENEIENVVQPDISVICDRNKLDEKGCRGAPDFIIEIISPSTSRKDRMEKFFLYERMGVKEYWLVSPLEKIVEVFLLGPNGKYGRPGIFSEADTLHSSILKGLSVDLGAVFSITIGEIN